MRDILAAELLAKVLNWSPEDIARERPLLQAMASFKYDSYEQYSPGMRFIESLALWLNQFDEADRAIAYEFIKNKLIFCSSQEMNHFVEVAYPDYIRPFIVKDVAKAHSMNPNHIGKVVTSNHFRIHQRQTLFLGLSDGVRIDTFRRANPDLNHEQILQTYEFPHRNAEDLLQKLREHLKKIDDSLDSSEELFKTIVLLDDFSASGTSYFMEKSEQEYSGKIAKFFESWLDEEHDIPLINPSKFNLIVLLYVATIQSLTHLDSCFSNLLQSKGISFEVAAVQLIPEEFKMTPDNSAPYNTLIENGDYYDDSVMDKHLQKGGTNDAKYGYAACGLPITLHHNTPNNALAILWSYETCTFRGLFPRVQRHKEME